MWRCDPTRVMASHLRGFPDYTQRRTTVGRTPLDEWSARRRDLYLTTHNTHNRQTSMLPVGFEPTILAGERADLRLRPRGHWNRLSLLDYSLDNLEIMLQFSAGWIWFSQTQSVLDRLWQETSLLFNIISDFRVEAARAWSWPLTFMHCEC